MNQLLQRGVTASIVDLLLRKTAHGTTVKIMLTGGRNAERLYKKWAEEGLFRGNSKSIEFFLTDERCVPRDNPDSNYHLISKTLFADQLPQGASFHRIEGDSMNLSNEAERYGRLLPESIDFLLLSMGEDGHVASLFPHSSALKEEKRKVVPTYVPKAPNQRLTITPQVMRNAKHVFVLALGDEKRRMYEKALEVPEDIESIPARLVLNRTWILDLEDEVAL